MPVIKLSKYWYFKFLTSVWNIGIKIFAKFETLLVAYISGDITKVRGGGDQIQGNIFYCYVA